MPYIRANETERVTAPGRRVLVTGASGFVGGHIVRKLQADGYVVRAMVRKSSNLDLIRDAVTETFEGDLTVAESLENCCDNVDAVIHSACAVASTFDAGRSAEAEFMRVNRDGTANLAREAAKHPGLRMVHISSTAAMGTPEKSVVNEDSPCNPTTPYQRSKRAGELELLKLHEEHELNVVIIRPCVIAGEGKDRSELLSLFKMVRRGLLPYIGYNMDLQKPMIMIDDLAQACIAGIEKGTSGQIYLVHSDGQHTMREILKVAGDLTGSSRTHINIPIPVARLAALVCATAGKLAPDWNPPITQRRIDLFIKNRDIDITKARRELDFQPKFQNLEEMLGRTYRYYRDKGLV